jgi:hypothetical protein
MAKYYGEITRLLETEGRSLVRDMSKALARPITKRGARGSFTSRAIASGKTRAELRREVRVSGNEVTLTIYSTDYWRFADRGRKAGSRPPIAAIQQWVEVKGIEPPGKESLSAAFAIAISIAKRGTARPPSQFAQRTMDESVPRLRSRMRAAITGGFRQEISLSISQTLRV